MFEPPRRPRTGALLFLPVRWQRVAVLKWLKRVHAWTGLWGALLFLGLGLSGFLLNHRSVLKIDTGQPVEVSRVDVALGATRFADAEALSRWAQARFALPVEGRAPPPEKSGPKAFMGTPVAEPERFVRVFNLTDDKVTVEHVPGTSVVSVRRESVGALATLKNLHKGTGLSVAWVLLIDTIAGALVTMSLTGVLLWSRLHGPRLLAAGIAGGSFVWALAAALPALTV